MKKLLLSALLTACAFPAFAEKPLIISTDGTYPPFAEMNANGEMVGFDIDIAKALCAEMKRKCEFKQVDWDGLIPALNNEQVDALIASMNANDERQKVVDFTEPYYSNPGLFVRKKGSNIEISDEGLKGKTIGVLASSIWDDYATQKYGKIAKIDRYTSQDDANLDAQKGVVDVLLADKIVMKDGFLDRDSGKDFEAVGDEVKDKQYLGDGIAIAVRKSDPELRDAFNAAIKAIRKNGEYKKVNDKYFNYDIYGIDD
ncbi:transporter substrate-binding domain-containing protein [Suttonella ornithocola]|uniref:Lysine-arginine-ornithine-binding periplasmic protein n=1 Tax=Suttonella ornithocola TaxID=279832 RepID=A0A380MW70_9GAMM|nr:transporter substrate-binding domain-containing protein [Suttonella ornithocola]SUO95961.1 Lysine-arginine-ornithine-binding periplasmic protein precursor [Suttonella ornithocola]